MRECKGLDARLFLLNFNNYVVWYLQYAYTRVYGKQELCEHIYIVIRNHMDLCLQGSGDLRMCGSQADLNTARILVF